MNVVAIVIAIIGVSASLGAIVADVSTECGPINSYGLKAAQGGLLLAGAGLGFMLFQL